MEYNSVLIVGNGFDRNLDLETGYTHFVKSEFFNTLIQSGNNLCSYLQEQHNLKNWIDIEMELKTYSIKEHKSEDRKSFKREYKELKDALCCYLNGLDISKIDKTSEAYGITASMPEDLLVINFNYTNSVEHIMDLEGRKSDVLHIHGMAKNNQIVFGVEDRAHINAKDVFLKKSYCVWNEIVDIENILSKVSEIYFSGHSLGETDHHYFSDFFSKMTNKHSYPSAKNIYITHHDEEGFDNIMQQIDIMTNKNIYSARKNHKFEFIPLA